MPLLFIDYTNLIIKAYEEKKDANQLSRLLMHPTTANIRQECLNVYNERIQEGEIKEDILRAFFGVPPAGKNFDYLIRKRHADKFRPLRSLMKRKTRNPSLINVELLAWLIDFTPRPLAFAQMMLGNMDEVPVTTISVNGNNESQHGNDVKKNEAVLVSEDNDLQKGEDCVKEVLKKESNDRSFEDTTKALIPINTISENSKEKNKFKRAVIISLILIICTGGIYAIWQQQGNAGCMYWAGDQYKPVSCNEDSKGRLILPLNEEKMKDFKKITKEDTITDKSIGVIYYIKIGGNIEYYTTGGNHPIYVTRPLTVLSRYMFDKYLGKKEILNDSLTNRIL